MIQFAHSICMRVSPTTKCFKQVCDILKSSVGDELLHTFVETTEEYKKQQDFTKQDAINSNSFFTWTTYIYINNTDSKRYGSLKAGLKIQFSLSNDQYPRELANATDILGNHRQDKFKCSTKNNNNNNNKNNEDKPSKRSFAQGKKKYVGSFATAVAQRTTSPTSVRKKKKFHGLNGP